MKDSAQLVDHVLTRFYSHMRERITDNYDAQCFSHGGVDRSKLLYLAGHKSYLWFFMKNTETFFRPTRSWGTSLHVSYSSS